MATNLRTHESSAETLTGMPDGLALEIDILDRVITFLAAALSAADGRSPADVAAFYRSETPLVIEDGRDALARLALAARDASSRAGCDQGR